MEILPLREIQGQQKEPEIPAAYAKSVSKTDFSFSKPHHDL